MIKQVFELWKIRCACDDGVSIVDCPGPPGKEEIEKVKAWMEDQSQPIDIYPFSDPDLWKVYLES